MHLEIYNGATTARASIKVGDYCNLLPSFMKDYDSYGLSQSEFTKEQYEDLIKRQIDIRVKEKAKPDTSPRVRPDDMWSYFRIEWYEDDKMYDVYLPDKHLEKVQYIFTGDRVIINPNRIEKIFNTYSLADREEDEEKFRDVYRKWTKEKTPFRVASMYYMERPTSGHDYTHFSNDWCVLENEDMNNYDFIEYVALPEWVLLKPMYGGNKKPQIKKFLNY